MTRERAERGWAVVLSVLLPIWNLWRLVVRAPGSRQFVVSVAGLRAMYKPSPIERLDWEEIISRLSTADGGEIRLSVPAYSGDPEKATRGSTTVSKLLTIAALLKFHGAESAFEIGTYMGVGTLWIASNLEGAGTCHTLDLPVDDESLDQIERVGDRRLAQAELRSLRVFEGSALRERIVEHSGDSMTFDFGDYERQMDFVYVDGEHSVKAIVKDTGSALTMLTENGFVVWDDYLPYHLGSHPGVREFINWFNRSVDRVYDIGGQAAWFARLSAYSPSEILDRFHSAVSSSAPAH